MHSSTYWVIADSSPLCIRNVLRKIESLEYTYLSLDFDYEVTAFNYSKYFIGYKKIYILNFKIQNACKSSLYQ